MEGQALYWFYDEVYFGGILEGSDDPVDALGLSLGEVLQRLPLVHDMLDGLLIRE